MESAEIEERGRREITSLGNGQSGQFDELVEGESPYGQEIFVEMGGRESGYGLYFS